VASALGASIAEFPTTLAAARAARGHGQAMVMGAPTWGISLTNSLTAVKHCPPVTATVWVSDYYPEAICPAALAVIRGGRGLK